MPTRVRAERKASIQLPTLSENMLLVMIVVGFCVLHILTAVYLMPRSASADTTPPSETAGPMFD